MSAVGTTDQCQLMKKVRVFEAERGKFENQSAK